MGDLISFQQRVTRLCTSILYTSYPFNVPAYRCPQSCSYNGVCNTTTGSCRCKRGFKGIACEQFHCHHVADCGKYGKCVGPNKCLCPKGLKVCRAALIALLFFTHLGLEFTRKGSSGCSNTININRGIGHHFSKYLSCKKAHVDKIIFLGIFLKIP